MRATLFSIPASDFRLPTPDFRLSCVFAHGLFDRVRGDVEVGYGPDCAAVAQDERLRRLVSDARARLYVAGEFAALLHDDYRDGDFDLLHLPVGARAYRARVAVLEEKHGLRVRALEETIERRRIRNGAELILHQSPPSAR